MFISDLFKLQEENYKKLNINPELDEYKTRARQNLELHVKVSDLASKTNCFAYTTDVKNDFDQDVILLKFVQCLKQVLTIGINNGYNTLEEVSINHNEYCLSDQFLNLYIDINDLIISRSEDHFETLLEDLLSIGNTLGLSEEEIVKKFDELSN